MTPPDEEHMDDMPAHLKRWPGLYIREGDRIVEASPSDVAVARSYPYFKGKGPVVDGKRITILTEQTAHKSGDEVRVIHVVEYIEPGFEAYVMGPKPVFGEYLNGELATPPAPAGHPLVPAEYNGVTLPSPAVDYNFEITSYTFQEPGSYRIQWRLGSLESNILTVTVESADRGGEA